MPGVSIGEQISRHPPQFRDDLRQEWQLELAKARAEHRLPRRFTWVAADFYRARFGRSRRLEVSLEHTPIAASVDHNPRRTAVRRSLQERAMLIALGLPIEQRAPIVLALRCLAPTSSVERVRAWLLAYPNRRASHSEIAADVGLTRETVCRAFALIRKPGPRRGYSRKQQPRKGTP